ncbi:MAG: recombinase family protein [Bryobacteraceae bacterium]
MRLRPSLDRRSVPAFQFAALTRAGCEKIFRDDGLSGATAERPALTRCLKELQSGGTLTVWNLDRPGRSLRDLITMPDDLRARGVNLHSLTEAIDTTAPTGRAMWRMIGVLAELERSLIVEGTPARSDGHRPRGERPHGTSGHFSRRRNPSSG